MSITLKKTFFKYEVRLHFLPLCLICLITSQLLAERLPLKTYSSADGLANDTVNKIVPDSRGFLWFGTDEGLSRFDGYSFKNYTPEHGLPHRRINDFLETQNGDYLIATNNGLAVFNPLGKAFRWNIIDGKLEQVSDEPPMFKTYLPPNLPDKTGSKNIISLAQDGNGIIYASARYGLYRFFKTADDWQFEPVESARWQTDKVEYFGNLFTDSRGDVWMGVDYFIYRILKNGEVEKVGEPGGNGFFEDKDGNIWVNSGGHDLGIRVFSVENNKPVLKTAYTKKDGLWTNGFTNAIAQTSDGKLFVTSNGKLSEFIPNAKDTELKFRPRDGELIMNAVNKDGMIWFGSHGKGIARYSPNSFYTFDQKDGLDSEQIGGIFGNRNVEVFLIVGKQKLSRVSDDKIEIVRPLNLPTQYWIDTFLGLQSADGEFWIPSTNGLFRYPKVSNFSDLTKTAPKKIYTASDGVLNPIIVAIFEDSRGDIWFSASNEKDVSLHRWEKSTDKIHQYEEGLPKNNAPISFGEDAAGNLWVGYYAGEIVRYKDGSFRDFTKEGAISNNYVQRFLTDTAGRLWLSTSNRGLFRVDEPNAEKPVFTNFSTADGLSSNLTMCLTQDNFGRIYVGTGRGINRLEPDTLRVKVFTQNDGLPGNSIHKCYADVKGNLWFASNNSLIKFTPEAEKPSAPPPIFVDAINVNGKPRTISELGEREVKNLEFAAGENQIQIGFFAISFGAGETLRYQYKLGGQDWSAPHQQRTVDLNLAPGSYDFSVRAITADGVLSKSAATVSFTIHPPFWMTWWFWTATLIMIGGVIFLVYNRRLRNLQRINTALSEAQKSDEKLAKERTQRLVELQKVRTRIAADLHDDIGASLTQISVLSSVARKGALEKKGNSVEFLQDISRISNELVEAMSDIVWAINPRKDSLHELILRMRRFASDILTAAEIGFEFETPETDNDTRIGTNIRREVFAIFKECINNIVRHSGAQNVIVIFRLSETEIHIKIADDGHGFDPTTVLSEEFSPVKGGNGLINMRRRAEELGGMCEIHSSEKGTETTLKIPLAEAIEEKPH